MRHTVPRWSSWEAWTRSRNASARSGWARSRRTSGGTSSMRVVRSGEVPLSRAWPSCHWGSLSGLGVSALLGRMLCREIERGSWSPEAVLPYRYWSERLGADPAVVGKTILLNGYPFTIVGITPKDFYGTSVGDYYEVRVAK